jgi:hypothetical protein
MNKGDYNSSLILRNIFILSLTESLREVKSIAESHTANKPQG